MSILVTVAATELSRGLTIEIEEGATQTLIFYDSKKCNIVGLSLKRCEVLESCLHEQHQGILQLMKRINMVAEDIWAL